ncbi:hypothetical protein FRC02_010695 [Tulasnella sp. 418]|nr:hypothetical protein FRC02_010695 [Tulasnella sp. 418]
MHPLPFLFLQITAFTLDKSPFSSTTSLLKQETSTPSFVPLQYLIACLILRVSYTTRTGRTFMMASAPPPPPEKAEEVPESTETESCDLCEDPLYPVALFETPEDPLGLWWILLSSTAYVHWKTLGSSDPAMIDGIHATLVELSHGIFKPNNQQTLAGNDNEVPIFSAKVATDLFLVYQVDCGNIPVTNATEVDKTFESQFIRIFAICSNPSIDTSFWSLLARQSYKKGCKYVDRQRKRARSGKPRTCIPIEFPDTSEVATFDNSDSDNNLSSEEAARLHSIVALERYLPYSLGLMEGKRAHYRKYSEVAQTMIACRNGIISINLFTMSREEEKIVYCPSSAIIVGRSGTGKTTAMLFRMIALEKAAVESGRPIRQLFVTQSAVLSRRVADFYYRHDSRLSRPSLQKGGSILDLVEDGISEIADEMELTESTLPSRWSQLKEEDFPLFLTFDQFCQLLQADLAPDLFVTQSTKPIRYADFLRDIWPHFNQKLKQGLDPNFIWSEFMGVIKGSEVSLLGPNGYMTRETYIKTRSRAISVDMKQRVWALFESYLKQKKRLRRADYADRTYSLLGAIRREGRLVDSVDFLYVDEVQDNVMLDVELLRKLCISPNGLFWAGDSAQTIATGSSFRFAELKSHLHSVVLRTNFRSHGGIINAAASVVEMISQLFPDSIDKLMKEQSRVNGPKPVVFFPVTENQMDFEKFLFGSSGMPIDFGAEQAILVRNEATQKSLQSRIGDLPLVLTLAQSKGLEFDDILIFDFFADSLASASDWRVVLNCLNDRTVRAPRFDDVRHAIIQNELKALYVALTRARHRVWIWDASDKILPMKTFWLAHQLILVQSPEDVSSHLAVKSSALAWRQRGYSLFQQRLYSHSALAFQKAGMTVEYNIAEAFNAYSDAEKLPSHHPESSTAWASAALAFDRAQQISPQDERQKQRLCLLAAKLYAKVPNHLRAATLFEQLEQWTKAVQHYRQCGLLENAIRVIRLHGQNIDQVVVRETIGVAKLFYVGRGETGKTRDLFKSSNHLEKFLDDLGLESLLIQVFEDRREYDKAAQLASQQGDEARAIQLFQRSHVSDWGEQALKSLNKLMWASFRLDTAMTPEVGYVDEVLEIAKPMKVENSAEWQELEVFVALHSDDHEALGLAISPLLRAGRRGAAILAMEHFLRIRGRSSSGASSTEFTAESWKFEESPLDDAQIFEDIGQTIHIYATYLKELRDLLKTIKRCSHDQEVQKLLRFHRLPVLGDKGPEYCIYQSSPALNVQRYAKSPRQSSNGTVVDQGDLERVLTGSLQDSYNQRVRDLHRVALDSQGLLPSHLHIFGVACGHDGCWMCPQPNPSSVSNSLEGRVQVLLQVISLLDGMIPGTVVKSTDVWTPHEMEDIQRIWLDRLFECLYPFSPAFGSLPLLDRGVFEDNQSLLSVVRAWLKSSISSFLSNDSNLHSSASSVAGFGLLASVLDTDNYSQYILEALGVNPIPDSLFPAEFTAATFCRNILYCLGRITSDEAALRAGVASIRYLNAASCTELPVGINVLITIIERLTTSLVFQLKLSTRHYRRYPELALNGVILPRSWMTQGLSSLRSLLSESPVFTRGGLWSLVHDFAFAIVDMLKLGESDKFTASLHRNRDPRQPAKDQHRNSALDGVFFPRLFRALLILTCNHEELKLRGAALDQLFTHMRNSRSPEIYSIFTESNRSSWDEIEKTLFESSLNEPSDRLCRLVLKGTPQLPDLAEPVIFRSYQSLCEQMKLNSTMSSLGSNITTPGILSSAEKISPFVIELFKSTRADPELRTLGMIRAVRMVSNARDRLLERRSTQRSTDRFFSLYLERMDGDAAGSTICRRYRMALLGPLPHLLSWLDEALKTCVSALHDQGRSLKERDGVDYDVASKVIKHLRSLKNDLSHLIHRLGPDSNLHSSGNVDELFNEVKLVLPLKDRVVTLLPRMPDVVLEDLRLALLGLSLT